MENEKKRIVFIHGWGYDSSVFQSLIEVLEDSFRVQTINLPGYNGEFDVSEYTLSSLIGVVGRQIKEPVTLVGWSMGGLVAMKLAEQYPERINKLILLAATPCFSKKDAWKEAMERKVLKNFRAAYNKEPKETLDKFSYLTVEGSTNQRAWLRKLKNMCDVEMSQNALKKGLLILEDTDLRNVLTRLKVPTLMMFGENDSLIPLRVESEIKKRNPDIETVVIKSAGHIFFMTDTKQVARRITEHVLR